MTLYNILVNYSPFMRDLRLKRNLRPGTFVKGRFSQCFTDLSQVQEVNTQKFSERQYPFQIFAQLSLQYS